MAGRGHLLYNTKSHLRGKPGIYAGVSRRENRAVKGETAPETDTVQTPVNRRRLASGGEDAIDFAGDDIGCGVRGRLQRDVGEWKGGHYRDADEARCICELLAR